MSENKEQKCCDDMENEIVRGFKFGFGFFLAFLAGFLIIDILAIAIYLIAKAAGISF